MPHPIDTLLVHMKDTLNEFGVSETVSAEVGAFTLLRVLDAVYYANPDTLMQNYESNMDFRQAALNQSLLYEQWLRPQLGLPPVRSYPEDDAIIAGLANHIRNLVVDISVMKEDFRSHGLDSKRWFAGVDASVAKASTFLQQLTEEEGTPEVLPPTRFEREPVL